MPNKEIAIEYTEDRYTSRNEMSRSIGFQISDLMWKKVTDYRANFNHPINLKWFGNKNFVLCVFPTFASKVNQVEVKINRLLNESNGLDKINGNAKHFKLSEQKKCIAEIAKFNGFDFNEDRLIKLISSENPFDSKEDQLVNYLLALKFINERYVNNIDIDFLAELYSKVTGNSELTSFYRNQNDVNVNSLSVVSRVYESAPVEYIETMMDSLFDFIKTSSISVVEKALITFEYFILIKPFDKFNYEMAILLAKSVLAHFTYGEVATSINLEAIINISEDAKRKMNNDVQQNVDLTYALTNYINIFDSILNDSLNLLREYSIKDLRNDFYKLDEAQPSENVVEEKTVEEPKEETFEEIQKEPQVIKEEPAKVHFESPKENKVEEEKIEEQSPKGLAVNYIPPVLDEKTASRLEQHLLEMDVELKRGEAYFYARHCTLGMYYTIDQYKKNVKCVYETARTSMEHLVKLGYYSKKQVGKKFVYTPVERK